MVSPEASTFCKVAGKAFLHCPVPIKERELLPTVACGRIQFMSALMKKGIANQVHFFLLQRTFLAPRSGSPRSNIKRIYIERSHYRNFGRDRFLCRWINRRDNLTSGEVRYFNINIKQFPE